MPEQACDCSIPFPKATAVLLNYCWMTVESHDETWQFPLSATTKINYSTNKTTKDSLKLQGTEISVS